MIGFYGQNCWEQVAQPVTLILAVTGSQDIVMAVANKDGKATFVIRRYVYTLPFIYCIITL